MAKDEGEFKVEDEDEDKKDSRDDEPDRKPPKPRPAPPPDDDYYRDRDRNRDRDGAPPPGYGPPPAPFFSANNLEKVLGIGVLLTIIILFVGALLISVAGFVDDGGLRTDLHASGNLIGVIGLFIGGLFILLPLLLIKDLSDRQKMLIGILLLAIILGFALQV